MIRMAEDYCEPNRQILCDIVDAELAYVRLLGANGNLAFASSNLSAYEALLVIVNSGEKGIPVYQAVASVRTPFSGQAGVINRLRAMRSLGLLEEQKGSKKSQVCLVPSEQLLQDLHSVLSLRHSSGFPK